jgi:basic amino acid/polyamine antiporter, APA family
MNSNNNLINQSINNLDRNIETKNKKEYNRNLSFFDLFFAGYGFIVGAGIFTLLPAIIRNGRGLSWFSFIAGGLICLITGLSYSKLNSLYPSNDAEYSWIMNVLNFDKNRDPEKTPRWVQLLANLIIWIVVVIGLLTAATVMVGQADVMKEYINVSKPLIIAVMLAIPSLITMFGNKYATSLNQLIMTLVTLTFVLLFGKASFKGTNSGDLDFNLKHLDFNDLLKSSFITIFAFNGFQSIVQLSEEAKDKNDVPKSIVSSVSFATLVYVLITVSVISLIGLNSAAGSVSPIGNAFGVNFGDNGKNIVNVLTIAALTNTILIITMSRSRLLQKLAVRGIAPKYLEKITSFQKFFGLEKFENNENNNNENNNSENTIPINGIITLSVVTFLLTFIKKGAVEYLGGLTSSFIFIVFTLVNLLVLINYFKNKTPAEIKKEEEIDAKFPLVKGYPWYGVVGLILSVTYLKLSTKYIRLLTN